MLRLSVIAPRRNPSFQRTVNGFAIPAVVKVLRGPLVSRQGDQKCHLTSLRIGHVCLSSNSTPAISRRSSRCTNRTRAACRSRQNGCRPRRDSSHAGRIEAHNSSSTDKKIGHRSSEVKSIFRHVPISSHPFFVTTHPKQSIKSETLLISPTRDVFRISMRRHKACP